MNNKEREDCHERRDRAFKVLGETIVAIDRAAETLWADKAIGLPHHYPGVSKWTGFVHAYLSAARQQVVDLEGYLKRELRLRDYAKPATPQTDPGGDVDPRKRWPIISCSREGRNADFTTKTHLAKVRYDEVDGGGTAPYSLRVYTAATEDTKSWLIGSGAYWTWEEARKHAERALQEEWEKRL